MFLKYKVELASSYYSCTVFKQGGLSQRCESFAATKTCVKFCAHFNTGSHVDLVWITNLSIASSLIIY